jgi:hypothetical protein
MVVMLLNGCCATFCHLVLFLLAWKVHVTMSKTVIDLDLHGLMKHEGKLMAFSGTLDKNLHQNNNLAPLNCILSNNKHQLHFLKVTVVFIIS